jgi:predicted lipoprotein with Yx(FWY)xxD motif
MAEDQPGNDSKSRSGLSPATVKWMVVGVIAIAFMVIFQSQLGRLLDRVSDVELSADGIKIKTVDTPIGKAEVSVVPVTLSSPVSDGIQGTTYTSNLNKFQISWPNASEWTADLEWGQNFISSMGFPATIKMPIVIMYNEIIGTTRPNVNVVVEKIGSMDVQDYINASTQTLASQGWKVVSSTVDESTQGGFLVLNTVDASGATLYQFQRVAVAHGNAYNITATQLPPENALNQRMKDELSSIVNSFRIIQ